MPQQPFTMNCSGHFVLCSINLASGRLRSMWRYRMSDAFHMSRIGHYLYYRVLESEGIIEVLSVWSDSRGEGPPI